MIGKLTIEKASMNMSYFLASVRILANAHGQLSRTDFIEKMARFMGCSPTKNGLENRVPYNKTKFPRYFGFIDINDNRDLVETNRGHLLNPYIVENEGCDPTEYYSITSAGQALLSELLFQSIVFDSFGKNNCGAEQSVSDVEPPKVILKALRLLGPSTKNELGFILWGLDCGEFNSFDEAISNVRTNRAKGLIDIEAKINEWGRSNFVSDFKLLDLLSNESIGLITKLCSESYQLSQKLSDHALQRIDCMSATYAPLQLIINGEGPDMDNYNWTMMGVLGRYGDRSQTFTYDAGDKNAIAFESEIAKALCRAYKNPKRNVNFVVTHTNQEEFYALFKPASSSLERINDLQSQNHGRSVVLSEFGSIRSQILNSDPSVRQQLPTEGICFPSNFNIIGVMA